MANIAIVKWSFAISGGGDRQALELALALQKMGHTVDVFCVDLMREKCFPALIDQLSVYQVEEKNKRKTHILAKYSFIKKLLYLIPHFMNKRRNLLALRDLIQSHEQEKPYDVINYHETEVYKLALYFQKEKNFRMLNDLFVTGESLLETLFRKWENFLLSHWYVKQMQQIIVLDKRNKAIVKKYLKTNAVVVHSGLDHNKFYYKRKYQNKKTLSLLTTGIFFPHRRYEDIIEALHIFVSECKNTDVKLTIIGEPKTDMAYYEKIQSLVSQYHLTNYVTFLGRVSEETLQEQYRTADIFIFPNNPQTWGLAVCEAMLAGCVAIVSKGSGVHEILEDKKTAFLVDPESPEQIAAILAELNKNPEKIKIIATAGQEFVQKHISWDIYAKDMFRVFSQ